MRRVLIVAAVAGLAACGSEGPEVSSAVTQSFAPTTTVPTTTAHVPSSTATSTVITADVTTTVTAVPVTSEARPSTTATTAVTTVSVTSAARPSTTATATTLDPVFAADAAAIAEAAGVPFEVAVLWLRLDVELDPLQEELAQELGDRHVGTWVDRYEEGVTINVGHLPGDRDVVADIVAASTLAEWVVLVERPFSRAQLRAEAARLRDLATGPLETGIRVSESAVVLYVGSEAALDELFEPGTFSPENRAGLPAIIIEAASGTEG